MEFNRQKFLFNQFISLSQDILNLKGIVQNEGSQIHISEYYEWEDKMFEVSERIENLTTEIGQFLDENNMVIQED